MTDECLARARDPVENLVDALLSIARQGVGEALPICARFPTRSTNALLADTIL